MLPAQRKKPSERRVLRVKRKLEEAQISTIIVARKKQKLSESLSDITSALGKVGIKSEEKLFPDRPENFERRVFRLIDRQSNEDFKVDQAKLDMQRSKEKRREKILAGRNESRRSTLNEKREEVPVKADCSQGSLEEKNSEDPLPASEITYINVLQEDKQLRPIPDSWVSLGGDERALGFTYDYYYLDEAADASILDVPQVLLDVDWSAVYDNDSEFDGSEDEFDSDDSNAEGYYQNDYPEEEDVRSSEDSYDPYGESEVPYFDEC